MGGILAIRAGVQSFNFGQSALESKASVLDNPRWSPKLQLWTIRAGVQSFSFGQSTLESKASALDETG